MHGLEIEAYCAALQVQMACSREVMVGFMLGCWTSFEDAKYIPFFYFEFHYYYYYYYYYYLLWSSVGDGVIHVKYGGKVG